MNHRWHFAAALTSTVAVTSGLCAPANAQSVSDQVLSDVKVGTAGTCSVLAVNFNVRIQVLSFFPPAHGRELHIRVKPLDTQAGGRESLRTPSAVPALRSIEYEGDNPSGPVLSLYFTRDVRFDVAAGEQPQTILVAIDDAASNASCAATTAKAEARAPEAATAPPQPGQPPRPVVPVPPGLYVVNVLSQPSALANLSDAQLRALGGLTAYESRFERDAQVWHRLRVGFFESRDAAEAARRNLESVFPGAWTTKVSAQEREQGVFNRLPMPETGAPPVAAAMPPAVAASDADTAAAAKALSDAEEAIKSGENDRAVQLLTNALTYPENEHSPRALELLGLTRERKKQLAHARAEYEEYLRRYPEGEGADRVRQRLAAITSPGTGAGTPELRAASASTTEQGWSWGARGSFSQYYFRDQSKTKFVDAVRPDPTAEIDNQVNLNQLLTSADVTISGGNDRNQLQLRAAGSYSNDFRRGGRDIKTINALYADIVDDEFNLSARIGRQTRNSSGVLGRFDGGLLGWRMSPDVRFNVVAGFPVLSSRQMDVLTDRFFYGASVDMGSKGDKLQGSLYWFDQRSHGFIDRQSVGAEMRYVNSRFNAFAILDYDIKFSKLNLGLVSLNYTMVDSSSFSLTADYRQSPLLTTTNALIGQYDTIFLTPIRDLDELRDYFSDDEIYGLAEDRTILAKSLTLSYSRPITKKLQANFDFTLTDTGGSPASGGVAEIPAAGSEYYYGFQLVGNGFLWSNDIYILSARYADTERSRTYTGDINARVPVSKKLRVSPRLRYGYRDDKLTDGTFRQLQPTLRVNYYPIRHSEVEIEFGANFSRQHFLTDTIDSTNTESGYVLNAGYRLDF